MITRGYRQRFRSFFLQQNSTSFCDVLGKVCWPWSGTNSDTNMGIEHLPTRQRQQILEYNPVWETTKSWVFSSIVTWVLMSTSWCDEAVETNSNPFLCSTGPFWLVSERKVQCHTRPKFGTKASVPSQKPCSDQTHFVQVPAPPHRVGPRHLKHRMDRTQVRTNWRHTCRMNWDTKLATHNDQHFKLVCWPAFWATILGQKPGPVWTPFVFSQVPDAPRCNLTRMSASNHPKGNGLQTQTGPSQARRQFHQDWKL